MKKSLVALLLVVAMLATLMVPAIAEEETSTPLVVAYAEFSEKFSPFTNDTGYDVDAVAMTQLSLMTTDRSGGIIYNAIEGETVPYNGVDYTYTGPADIAVSYDEATDITTYSAKIREDLCFSDGEKVTADDIIFTYYVYLDPAYVGSTTLNSYDIVGLNEYRTQTTSDVYDKYAKIAADIYAAGVDHVWAETDSWTSAMQDSYWAIMKGRWTELTQAIVDYVYVNYVDGYGEATLGKTPDEISAEVGLQVAFGMAMWNFATVSEDFATLTGNVSGNTWDIAGGVYPTIEDYYAETYAGYAGDPDAFWETEKTGDDYPAVHGTADNDFVIEWGPQDESMEGGIKSISGITKTGDYSVEVKLNGFSAPAVYSVLGIQIVPMHYYGDASLYDYENGMYGFNFGDMSIIDSKTTQPMGAGAYKFIKYENRVIYYEANDLYYKGAPKTKYVQFKETDSAEVAAGVATGTVDAGELTGSRVRFEEIMGYNTDTNGLDGAIVTTSKVDNLGYGYIGLNADTVNVGGEPASDASKNLRKALATVISVYRDVAINSYYGEAASVINYPISNTSWAAPQPTDEDYHIAFSLDVDGNEIYTSDMSQEQKYEAAIAASIGYFKAAGYTFDETAGVFTAAPEGAKLSYECYVGGDGIGDHPSFGVLNDSAAALKTIGIDLVVNDLVDTNVMWDALDAGTQELWCAAWGSTIDPDMYQVYHSSNIVGLGGSDSNHYHIADAEMDQLILDARVSADQSYRKAVYKQVLDTIVDWAVEIPTYQRQNCIVFSTERVNLDTLTPDITTYWGWMSEIEKLEMN